MAAADQKITAQLLLKSTKSNYLQLAERLGVARGKKEKICEEEKLKQKHSPATQECPQKNSSQSVQPFGRLYATNI